MYFTKQKVNNPVPGTEYQLHTKPLSIVYINAVGWSKKGMFHCQLLGFVKPKENGIGFFIFGQYIGLHWGKKQNL